MTNVTIVNNSLKYIRIYGNAETTLKVHLLHKEGKIFRNGILQFTFNSFANFARKKQYFHIYNIEGIVVGEFYIYLETDTYNNDFDRLMYFLFCIVHEKKNMKNAMREYTYMYEDMIK